MTTFSTAIRTFPELTQEEIGERVWRKRDSITHAVTNISTLNNRVIAQLPNQPPNIADLRTLQAGDTFLGQGTFGSLTETHLYTVLKSKGDILWFYYHNPGDAII